MLFILFDYYRNRYVQRTTTEGSILIMGKRKQGNGDNVKLSEKAPEDESSGDEVRLASNRSISRGSYLLGLRYTERRLRIL